jgi:2-oxoglutarate dehydrogenase E1 component
LTELAEGAFQKILPDEQVAMTDADRLIFCTGKVYYDLLEAREDRNLDNVAIMRIEQLYPLNIEELLESMKGLAKGTSVYWVQEEPTNMGAWPYIKLIFGDELSQEFDLKRVSRVESASPSTGSMAAHKLEQAELIEEALADL